LERRRDRRFGGNGHYDIAVLLAALNLFTLRALLPLKLWIDRKRNPSL
jgi:hypothetical protein